MELKLTEVVVEIFGNIFSSFWSFTTFLEESKLDFLFLIFDFKLVGTSFFFILGKGLGKSKLIVLFGLFLIFVTRKSIWFWIFVLL